jgi:hypothetical protein
MLVDDMVLADWVCSLLLETLDSQNKLDDRFIPYFARWTGGADCQLSRGAAAVASTVRVTTNAIAVGCTVLISGVKAPGFNGKYGTVVAVQGERWGVAMHEGGGTSGGQGEYGHLPAQAKVVALKSNCITTVQYGAGDSNRSSSSSSSGSHPSSRSRPPREHSGRSDDIITGESIIASISRAAGGSELESVGRGASEGLANTSKGLGGFARCSRFWTALCVRGCYQSPHLVP